MQNLDALFAALDTSAFRRRFRLGPRERDYLAAKGLPVVLQHARDIIGRRLAPARPAKDGKQTPFRGHPVFVAQHATATCCRGCLEKWHHVPRERALTDVETDRVLDVLAHWLSRQSLQGRTVPARRSAAQTELMFETQILPTVAPPDPGVQPRLRGRPC